MSLSDLQPVDGNVVSRWPEAKMAGKVVMGAASVGIQVAQQVTGASTLALLTAGAAASATGIGLVVAGAAVTLATVTASAMSAYKTSGHIDGLKKIQERAGCYGCTGLGGGTKYNEHQVLVSDILPYILSQKETKFGRKVMGAVGLGALQSLRAIGRNLQKRYHGTLGAERDKCAAALAVHLITHNCGLAQAIVAELYSFEEMVWMLDQDSSTLVPLLRRKMAST